ncbi:MAG: SH3 domain-containing protein [Oscillospiraceae bacterium]|nr:SH3 domain-containing protein [Oscillospiraceae bacterium]
MRKKLLQMLLLIAVLGGLFSTVAYAETATLTGGNVNLRSGPGMNYEVLGCFAEGTVVVVNDRSDAHWYSVTVEGCQGFMSAQYLRMDAQQETPESADGAESGYINAMFVRLRSDASAEASILGEYNSGTPLTITGVSGEWTAVIIHGQSGYVFSSYVSRSTTDGQAPAQETPAPAESAPETSDGSNAVLIKDDVYLFDAPSFYSEVKGVFNKGERLTVSEENGDWLTVSIYGFPGYIYRENVSRDDAPAPTPAPTPVPTPVPTPGLAQTAKTGYVNADHVHLRSEASVNSEILAVFDRNTRLTINATSGDWVAVSVQTYSGYIYKDYVTADDTPSPTPAPSATPAPGAGEEGYIKGNNVRMRAEPSMSGEIIGEYNAGKKLTITGTTGDWTAVKIDDQTGYVYSTYVARGEVAVAPDLPDSSDEGTQMAQFALQFVGYPYVWAGKTPEVGFDCSGLVYYVFHTTFGYNMYRVANDQMQNGVHVEPDQLQPGDILGFYSSGGYVGHVGIYIGDGKFVHASTYTTGVIVSELNGYYYDRGFEARRIAGTDKNGPGIT